MLRVRQYYAVMYDGELKLVFWFQYYDPNVLLRRIADHDVLSCKPITETEATTLREFCNIPLLHYVDVPTWIDRKRYRDA